MEHLSRLAIDQQPPTPRGSERSNRLRFENARLEAELRSRIADLRASRARIVSAADAERRRIERDLHDGAQQRLISLRIKLGVLAEQLAGASSAERELVQEIACDAEQALDELQALVRGIYPPVLADRGISAALRALVAEAPVRMRVDATRIARYPAGIEAAVYFCCLEAVQNVAKHAGRGAEATVALTADADHLRFDVRDAGAGIDPLSAPGTGIANMEDRIWALGGELEISSVPGEGTSVRGSIPTRQSRS